MDYCDQCTDHEECRSAGCSNPRRHPQQLSNNGNIVYPKRGTTQQEGDKLLFCHQWIAEQARNIERLQQIIAEKDAQLDAFGIKYPQMLDNVYNDALEKAATIVESRGVDGTRYTIAGIIRDNKRKYRG
jgi:hypothetical protein